MTGQIKSFKDLDAWKEGHKFVLGIYTIASKLPKKEQFGLISQMERAAVSITSNIAEGFSRYYFKDKIRFYYMARGSVSELQNLLTIALDLDYIKEKLYKELFDQSTRILSLINGLINSISKQINK
ncbi:four helix bundle protein [Patescibacteria group bacterium]|nr:four helix bundle protein [Patescibacteria group bacterium]MBU0964599.1 four helix bundle protein [Patescibacteria group bacterium]